MIVYDTPEARFNLRVAGACLHRGHVLAQTTQHTNFYVLPGGRVEVGEDSVSALKREMHEELGCDIEVRGLLWVVENFFSLEGRSYHEISLIHEMTPENPALLNPNRTLRRTPADEPDELSFRWLALKSLASNNLKPDFLHRELLHPPKTTKHLIVREQRKPDPPKRAGLW